jgi:hypothetical protein
MSFLNFATYKKIKQDDKNEEVNNKELNIQEQLNPNFISKIAIQANKDVESWINKLKSTKGINIINQIAIEFYSTPLVNEEIKIFLASNLNKLKSLFGLHRLLMDEFELLKGDDNTRNLAHKISLLSDTCLVRYFRTEMILERFYILLLDNFPDNINHPKDCQWTWNNFGFTKCRQRKIYSNFDTNGQYIVIWGTSERNLGYSGINKDIQMYNIMLSGMMLSYSTHSKDIIPNILEIGEIINLDKNQNKYYQIISMSKHDPVYNNYVYNNNFKDTEHSEPYVIDIGIGNINNVFPDKTIKPCFFLNYDYNSMVQQIILNSKTSDDEQQNNQKKECIIL